MVTRRVSPQSHRETARVHEVAAAPIVIDICGEPVDHLTAMSADDVRAALIEWCREP